MASFGDPHWVSGAGWSLAWRLSPSGSGLEIWWADFHGRRVMWRGSAPIAIVPYHHDCGGGYPKPPEFTFKDGLDPQCDGAPYTPLKHWAANSGQWRTDHSMDAALDTEAVVVTTEASDDFHPARLVISAKFQCGWYQYVYSWEFSADGVIHPHVALGGELNPNCRSSGHVHHIYFRVDLDIDGLYPNDVFEVFDHPDFSASGDTWTVITAQQKLLADPGRARKFRVRNTKSKNSAGELKGYEIELPQLAGRDKHGTGDVWVTIYRGDGVEQGEGVGANPECSDRELETAYAVGPLDTANGSDIVFWAVVRAHHEPRHQSEEAVVLPYHYEGFSITPRSFEVFRERPHGRG